MANFDIITFDSSGQRQKRQPSSTNTFDFSSIRVGTTPLEIKEVAGSISLNNVPLIDVTYVEIGPSGLKISEVGGNYDMGNHKIVNVTDPTAPQDVATKSYVDAVATGLDVKQSVRLATAAALPAFTAAGSGVGKTLTGNANGALSVDSVAAVATNRVLVKNEALSHLNHGIYVVTAAGDASNPYILTRAGDFDQAAEVTAGSFTFVEEGTINMDSGWLLVTDNPITIDTTAQQWTQFSGAGSILAGAGLLATGNLWDIELDTAAAALGAGSGGGSSGLEFDTAGAGGKLRAKVISGSALERQSGGLQVMTDGSTLEITVNSLNVKAAGITSTQLAASVAGAGITGGAGSALDVELDTAAAALGAGSGGGSSGLEFDAAGAAGKLRVKTISGSGLERQAGGIQVIVDSSTIEISTNTIRVKAAGITESHLNTSVAGAGISGGGGAALAVELDTTAAATGAGSGGGSSGLEFDAAGAAGKLRAAVSASGALQRAADGLGVRVDGGARPTTMISGNDLHVKHTVTLVSDATAASINDIVFIKANGNFDKAQANVANLEDFELGFLAEAVTGSGQSKLVYTRRGAIVSGFSGLTPGQKCWVDRSTAGAITQTLAGFVAGEFVYSVGRALSATEVLYAPSFEFEY
jgi:hypothetical protein